MATSSKADLNCYHSMSIARAKAVPFTADARYTPRCSRILYRWLQKQIRFYPHFLSIGNILAVENTFYQRWCTETPEQYDQLLATFKFSALSDVVFTDFNVWVNGDGCDKIHAGKEPGPRWYKELFKPSWSPGKWCTMARENFDGVQLLVPALDLTKATEIWVQDPVFVPPLTTIGLKNVIVRPACKGDDDLLPVGDATSKREIA